MIKGWRIRRIFRLRQVASLREEIAELIKARRSLEQDKSDKNT